MFHREGLERVRFQDLSRPTTRGVRSEGLEWCGTALTYWQRANSFKCIMKIHVPDQCDANHNLVTEVRPRCFTLQTAIYRDFKSATGQVSLSFAFRNFRFQVIILTLVF